MGMMMVEICMNTNIVNEGDGTIMVEICMNTNIINEADGKIMEDQNHYWGQHLSMR